MSERLNLLFQTAPRHFLERTVLFTDELKTPAARALMRNRLAHHLDIQPIQTRSTARVLTGAHEYTDTPLITYFVPPGGFALIPREDPPYRFTFVPEFVGCRILIRHEGNDWLRVECEENLVGTVPPASYPYSDSFAYWDQTNTAELVGRIRATAVIVKEAGRPWTVMMQQIVGPAGNEVVRQVFTKALRY
jgi:hypothetical protein